MSHDLQEVEARLRALRPAALEAALSARLADSARGTFATLSPAEAEFEASLRRIKPAPLAADLTAALLRQLAAPQPKVVPFPAAPPTRTRNWGRYMLPVAAAVALLGAAAALLVPTRSDAPNIADTAVTPSPKPFQPAPPSHLNPPGHSDFVPAGFSTNLSKASDEGVLWQTPSEARRVIKVTYRDQVTLVDQEGRKVEVEQPRVEYIFVPEKLD